MPEEQIHQIVGKALTEPAFREALLRNPQEAIRRFGLSEREQELVASVQAGSLEEFAQQLRERLEQELPAVGNGNGRGAPERTSLAAADE